MIWSVILCVWFYCAFNVYHNYDIHLTQPELFRKANLARSESWMFTHSDTIHALGWFTVAIGQELVHST